ncbi:transcriptional regulator [Polaromonas sp.]|nr:transcriptional regulator [Polaromonas sp.]
MDYPILSPSQLAQQLRSLRKALGLSQADLGTRMGLSQSRVARIENSPTQVSVDTLLRLLSALGAKMVLSNADAGLSSAPNDADKGDW